MAFSKESSPAILQFPQQKNEAVSVVPPHAEPENSERGSLADLHNAAESLEQAANTLSTLLEKILTKHP